MQLAEHFAPKKKLDLGTKCEDGVLFCPSFEAARAFLSRTAGKKLFVSDTKHYDAVAAPSRAAGAMCIVLDGEDALPLFSLPDGVGGIFAAGGESVMRAARLFACVRRIPCTLVPADCALDGVFSPREEVPVGGSRIPFPLAEAEVVCDGAVYGATLGSGYARLLLARLAVFEQRALLALTGRGEPSEAVFGALLSLGECVKEDVLRLNAFLRKQEGAGVPAGEGVVLAKLLAGEDAEYTALRALTALYAAFFRRGRPRLLPPDYARRSAMCGRTVLPPTKEEYARRADMLKLQRGDLLRELQTLMCSESAGRRLYAGFSGRVPRRTVPRELLGRLPDLSDGLSAVIRDFGLLEEV